MSKVRVYEVARELGMNNRELVALFQSLGFAEVRNHMSAVEQEVVERIKRKLERRDDAPIVEEKVAHGVVKRRGKGPRPSSAGVRAPASRPSEPSVRVAEPLPKGGAEARPAAERPRPKPVPVVKRDKPVAKAPEPSRPAIAEPVTAEPAMPAPPDRGQPEPAHEPTPTPAPRAEGAEPAPERPAPREAAPAPPPAAESRPAIPPPPKPSRPKVALDEPARKPAPAPRPPSAEARAPRGATPTPAPARPPSPSDSSPPGNGPRRPTSPPKTGIEVWEGRPGVPMPPRPHGAGGAPRRTTYDPRATTGGRFAYGRPGGPPGRPGMRPGFRPRPGGGYGRHQRRGAPEVSTKEMSEHKKVIKIEGEISLQNLANKMSLKATDVLMKLLGMGMGGVNINSTLDADTAKLLSEEFGWTVEDVSIDVDEQLEAQLVPEEDVGDATPRPPIVTVMGHVDHGKTTLLDRIRQANVAAGEAGGITQHIGAYRVETSRGTLCFLDTPGHEAFTAMRARGAGATDIVILVVAADDGVMPQTREAINHARAAKVPIIVAINKIDKPGVDFERIMRELSNEGLNPEDWGGDTIFARVSALKGEGVEELLEMVQIQSEVLELTAHPQKRASGVVVEALLDKGRGSVARVLVQDGTLRQGDIVLCGTAYGKIRAMTDETGQEVKEAGPSTPVEILGLNEVPDAGDPMHALGDIKSAEGLADERKKRHRKGDRHQDAAIKTLGQLREMLASEDQLELKVILKADVQGSVEAIRQALEKQSTKQVKLTVVHTAVGGITETDVNLAVASGAIIIGFNVRPAGKSRKLAEHEGVEIRLYNIIYEAIDDVRSAMEGLLPATKVEKELGKAEVRQVFRITKVGTIAGCMITEGIVKRNADVRLVRDSVVVWEGKLSSLKRFKEDAREVREGFECGIGLEGYNDLKEGDIVECFTIEEVKAKLEG
jgi:translation initiation factor IF-2